MTARGKKLLERIVKEINSGTDGRELWDILSALRGPDTDDNTEELKAATTEVIRHKLGLKNEAGLHVSKDSKAKLEIRRSPIWNNAHWHFKTHVRKAFDRLGLSLIEVNK